MKAIILAAGACRRLRPYTDDTPKCLLEIGPKPILGHQLDSIIEAGIMEVVIVVGYLKEKIYNYVKQNYPQLKVKFIVNEDFLSTNTLYSLWLTKGEMKEDDFIYFNGDVLFHPEITRLLANAPGACLAVDFKACGDEEVKVILNGNRVTEIGKELSLDKSVGEFVGIGKFTKEINGLFIEKLEDDVKKGERSAFFEKAVNELLSQVEIYVKDISCLPCIEIDFPEDLDVARNEVYPKILELDTDVLGEVATTSDKSI